MQHAIHDESRCLARAQDAKVMLIEGRCWNGQKLQIRNQLISADPHAGHDRIAQLEHTRSLEPVWEQMKDSVKLDLWAEHAPAYENDENRFKELRLHGPDLECSNLDSSIRPIFATKLLSKLILDSN